MRPPPGGDGLCQGWVVHYHRVEKGKEPLSPIIISPLQLKGQNQILPCMSPLQNLFHRRWTMVGGYDSSQFPKLGTPPAPGPSSSSGGQIKEKSPLKGGTLEWEDHLKRQSPQGEHAQMCHYRFMRHTSKYIFYT